MIVSLAAVTWDFPLVGRTRMLTEAWARLGQPTVFVQVPSLRTALQRVLPRPSEPDGQMLRVVRPWPTFPAGWWKRLGRQRLERSIRGRAAGLRRQLDGRLHWDKTVALVVSPVWTPWLDDLPFGRVVYDCIDDLAVQVPRADLLDLYRHWEERLIGRAHGAVATAQRLADGLRARRSELPIALIRNGVDAEQFQRSAAGTPAPADVPRRNRPVVGFVGALYEWIDWELIRATAERLPGFDFVFVGPHDRRGDVRRVASLPNVHLLGPRPYARVPAYVRAFDACWVPFKQNDVGAAANPVKIYEYLALGKPVVTTPVADTASFGELLAVARTAVDMAGQLRAAVAQPSSTAAARVAFAQANSWEVRARDYLSFLATL